jgi:ribosomal protein S18 acetylase RimI-like enzyme
MNVTYNPPYYGQYLEANGFEKSTDHVSGFLTKGVQLPGKIYEIARRVKERDGFWIRTFRSKKEMHAMAPRVLAVQQKAFINNHEFFPPSGAEADMVVNSLISIMNPSLVKLVMKGDEIAGFLIGYPNVSAALQRTRGRLLPFGWVDILLEQRSSRTMDINGLGFLPEYRGMGGNALLYTELEKTIRGSGLERVEIVQVNEINFRSKNDMETLGVIWDRRHRHYTRAV